MSDPIVLGEGAYGCVHKPSLVCGNKKLSYKNKISKIMLSKEAMKELKEYTLISRIDKKNDFYVGMPIKCSVKNTNVTLKAISKCKNIKRKYFKRGTAKDQLKKMALLIMNDGGKDLKAFAKSFAGLSYSSQNVNNIKKFWIEAHRLFLGIASFQKFDIAHHDVKPQNIVYNSKTNRINFIDFGHMRNMKREFEKCERSDNWIYDYPFWNYPFEIQFLNKFEYMDFVSKDSRQREKFVAKFISDIKNKNDTKFTNAFRIFMDYILKGKKPEQEKEIFNHYIIEFQKMVLDQMPVDGYESFVKKSIESIDIYGLGMTLQFVLAYFHRFMDIHIVRKMESCFFKMMTPNLLQRYSYSEAMDEYENIISEYLEEFGLKIENHQLIKLRSSRSVEKN